MQARIGGVNVAYEEHGDGLPLIGLHGIMLDRRSLRVALEPHFTERAGWRRIYIDLPGHGETPAASAIRTHDDMLDIVLALLDELVGTDRFALAGVSYGALLARGIAQLHPERIAGLMLAVPPVLGSPLPPFRVRRADPAFADALEPDERDKLDWIAWQTTDVLATVRAEVDAAMSLCDRAFVDRLPALPELAALDAAPPVTAEFPTLVVAGRSDAWCGFRGAVALLDAYPLASVAVLDGAGHAAHLERPELFTALVADWLDRVEC